MPPTELIRLPPHLVPDGCPAELSCTTETHDLWKTAVSALSSNDRAMVGHYLHAVVVSATEARGLGESPRDFLGPLESSPRRAEIGRAIAGSARGLGELDGTENMWLAFQVAYEILAAIEARPEAP